LKALKVTRRAPDRDGFTVSIPEPVSGWLVHAQPESPIYHLLRWQRLGVGDCAVRDWVINGLGFASVPESLKRDTTDLSSGLVHRVTTAEINNIAVIDDDPVVPVAHAGFDTEDLQVALNLDMPAEFEHCSKVPASPLSGPRLGRPNLRRSTSSDAAFTIAILQSQDTRRREPMSRRLTDLAAVGARSRHSTEVVAGVPIGEVELRERGSASAASI